jgi:hypothetical protein
MSSERRPGPHLAFMEDINFSRDLAGLDLPPAWNVVDWSSEQGWEWRSAAQDTPEQLYALWGDAVARSRSAVAHALADAGMDRLFSTASGKSLSLRRLLVDMIEEHALPVPGPVNPSSSTVHHQPEHRLCRRDWCSVQDDAVG